MPFNLAGSKRANDQIPHVFHTLTGTFGTLCCALNAGVSVSEKAKKVKLRQRSSDGQLPDWTPGRMVQVALPAPGPEPHPVHHPPRAVGGTDRSPRRAISRALSRSASSCDVMRNGTRTPLACELRSLFRHATCNQQVPCETEAREGPYPSDLGVARLNIMPHIHDDLLLGNFT
jgi:hypothetical protein